MDKKDVVDVLEGGSQPRPDIDGELPSFSLFNDVDPNHSFFWKLLAWGDTERVMRSPVSDFVVGYIRLC